MNKQEKQKNKDRLLGENDSRIIFLQQQIDNLTLEFNSQVKVRQDEIDSLTLQSDALKDFKI